MVTHRNRRLFLNVWARFFGLLLVVFVGLAIIRGSASVSTASDESAELSDDGSEEVAADEWESHDGHRWTVHLVSRVDAWGTLGEPLEAFRQELIQPPRARALSVSYRG